jgi:predicted DNA-binding transcriptional regulator YafY
MAKKRSPRPSAVSGTVTAERAARLYRLLTLLATGPQTRDVLRRKLGMDVRSFYRDLELLRTAKIAVPLRNRVYTLEMEAGEACSLLPFPDPHLSLGDAVLLAQGRTAAHRKLRSLIDQIVGKQPKGQGKTTKAKRR